MSGFSNGGPAGLIYGYLFVWAGASLQALVLAEMGSMYVNFVPFTPRSILYSLFLHVLGT